MGLEPGLYKHYKGTIYEVILIAGHTETGHDMAVYFNPNIPEAIWVRPVSMFFDVVENEEGLRVQRFERVED